MPPMPETLLIASLCITLLILAWGREEARREARELRELYWTQLDLANVLAARLDVALREREAHQTADSERRPLGTAYGRVDPGTASGG